MENGCIPMMVDNSTGYCGQRDLEDLVERTRSDDSESI